MIIKHQGLRASLQYCARTRTYHGEFELDLAHSCIVLASDKQQTRQMLLQILTSLSGSLLLDLSESLAVNT